MNLTKMRACGHDLDHSQILTHIIFRWVVWKMANVSQQSVS